MRHRFFFFFFYQRTHSKGQFLKLSTINMCIFLSSSVSARVLVMMNFLSGLIHSVIRAPDCVESEMLELRMPIAASNE